ncbi:MAG: group II intron maturase-specific domain-containing protein [Sedimenticola sp.]
MKEGREWAVAVDLKSFFDEIPHGLILQLIRHKVADDFVIVVRSERAAQRVMKGTIAYLVEELGLIVNREKSCVAPVKDITFLGFQILIGKIRDSNKARIRFKDRVRELTRRNNPLSMYQVIYELCLYLRGWVGYFWIQELKYLFRDLGSWIRSRLRSTQLKKWKKPVKFQRIMIKAGFDPHDAHRVWIKMNRWQPVMRRSVRFVVNLD